MNMRAQLRTREREIARLLAWGASKKEIAEQLYISTRTVENHARAIYEKLNIGKATELCVWWFCTQYRIPIAQSPVKRLLFSAVLLLAIVPKDLLMHGDSILRFREPRTIRRAAPRPRQTDKPILFLEI